MKVVILAAGSGSRLKPYTDEVPKGLVKVNGVPILQYQKQVYQSCGLKDITVIGGYKADKLKPFFDQIIINSDFDKTNMVYSLFLARQLFDGSEDIIVSYSDIIFSNGVLRKLIEGRGPISIIVDDDWLSQWQLRYDDPLEDAETMQIDEKNHIIDFGKKPQSLEEIQAQYIGLIKISRDVAESFFDIYLKENFFETKLKGNKENMYMTDYLRELSHHGIKLKAEHVSGGWFEIDTTRDLEVCEGLVKADKLSFMNQG